MKLALRFDMRAPKIGVAPSVLYPASVDMCEWADGLGFETVYLAEHHGAEDGYCPSPIVQASAIAARTSSMRIHFSALIAVLHHPLRLAEDLAVLDLISGGRIELTLGIGYRPHEYVMMGVEQKRRVQLLEEIIQVFEQAWSGEPFEFRGQTVVVRPTPVQQPRPPLYIGGSTEASAYRAAKWGDNYFPAGPGLLEIYQAERRRLGLPVPPPPRGRGPLFLFVTDDPERDWPIVAPHVMYTSNSNAEWAKERGSGSTPYPPVTTVDEMKQETDKFAVVTPEQCVALAKRLGDDAEMTFQPLMGALDPEISWRSLRLFETDVLPHLVDAGLRPATGSTSEVRR